MVGDDEGNSVGTSLGEVEGKSVGDCEGDTDGAVDGDLVKLPHSIPHVQGQALMRSNTSSREYPTVPHARQSRLPCK
jgi:hypothetical protein